MYEVFDVSVPLGPELPVWPGSPGVSLAALQRLSRGDGANVSHLSLELHTGTHVDAPWHFLEDGGTVETLSLEDLMGPALVVDLRDREVIDRRTLASCEIPAGATRILLKTSNSRLWERSIFTRRYAALTAEAAEWVVERGIRLVGIDYLSIQRFEDDPETHRILLRSGVVIVEGLDLSQVEAGEYELICLPINLRGVEGAPARAVLRRLRPVSVTGTP
jgi:arylformamidase